MAAVAPAQYEARTINLEYSAMRCDVEATGEEKLKAGIVLDKPVRIKNRASTEFPQAELFSVSGQKDDSSSRGDIGAGVANLPNGKIESDDVTAEAELSDAEKMSVEENDGLGKDFKEADSEVAEDWRGGTEAAEKAEVEVANRNNCMLVFWHQKTSVS